MKNHLLAILLVASLSPAAASPGRGNLLGLWIDFADAEAHFAGKEATQQVRLKPQGKANEWLYVLSSEGKTTQTVLSEKRNGQLVTLVDSRGRQRWHIEWINDCLLKAENPETGAWFYWLRIGE